MKENKKRFAEWLAIPKKQRQPKTQKELAALLGVCPDTLTRWKSDPEVRALVDHHLRDRLEKELPDVFQVIIDKAKDGSYQYVKLILELTEKYNSKVTINTGASGAGIESHADLIKSVEDWLEANPDEV